MVEIRLFPKPVSLIGINSSAYSAGNYIQLNVSIIIVNFNSGKKLNSCLKSLDETDSLKHEIIVVDNASKDGSADLIMDEFPGIHMVQSPVNIGFGAGSNLGASQAHGDYLVFLNPDTIVSPGWLDGMILALQEDPMAGLATPKILLTSDPRSINTCGNDVHLSGLTLCRGLHSPAYAFDNQVEVAAVSGAAFVIRQELFNSIGGFDEDFFLYMEDTDLSLRARLAGYHCLYVPGSVIYHDYSLNFGPRKIFYQERNRYQMLLKCYRWPSLLILMPTFFLAEIITWSFSILLGWLNIGEKLKAYVWVIQHWRKIMQKRKFTQSNRRKTDKLLIKGAQYRLGYEQTGSGWLASLAHLIFDPFFSFLYYLSLNLFYW